jgi:hypothetical protein
MRRWGRKAVDSEAHRRRVHLTAELERLTLRLASIRQAEMETRAEWLKVARELADTNSKGAERRRREGRA